MTRILALDLGTKCGYAIHTHDAKNPLSGVWDLKPTRFESVGIKFVKFRTQLLNHIRAGEIDHIVYEEVRMHMAVDAAHSYGGFLAILHSVAIDCSISYEGIPVGTIKKHATGKGNAKKPDMIRAANKFFPGVNVVDDNHADALCLLHYAIIERTIL